MTSTEIEPATFRLVAKCLKQLRYCVPQPKHITRIILEPLLNIKREAMKWIQLGQDNS
jgi:hypothetical protein